MHLILAEKPSLGRAIADALPGTASGRDPIYKGDWAVTWAYGHILSLKEPEDYDSAYKKWRLDALPIYFEDWAQKPAPGKEEKLSMIGQLLAQADSVVHAGDPDDEGQYLIDEILRWFRYSGPVYRLDTANTTKEALQKALRHMQDNRLREADGWSAHARAIADLMVGVNMSRFYTLKNQGTLLTVGRVQTPALGLVVNRNYQIENHIRQVYYTMSGIMDIDGKSIPIELKPDKNDPRLIEGQLLEKDIAEGICGSLEGKTFDGVQIAKESAKEQPPLPFNLVKLQTYCGNKWGYDPQAVMDITQSLRERYNAITYNRSDCQYLGDEHFKEAPKTVATVCANIHYTPRELDTKIRSRAFNPKRITAHHAIIPTDKSQDLSRMTEAEKNVYLAVCKYYLAQFLPPAEKQKTNLRRPVEGVGEIQSFSTVITSPGYRAIFSELKADPPTVLSDLPEGTYAGRVHDMTISEKETKPPSYYTKVSLNEDMTRIAKYVEDPEIKALLLKKDEDKKGENGSIGTTATRASIIDNLVSRGFLEEHGKRLVSTELGRELYRVLPDDLKKPNLTAYWWVIQEQIKSGESDFTELPKSVLETIRRIMETDPPLLDARIVQPAEGGLGQCPVCGGRIMEGKKGFGCTGWKRGCKFTIWKTRSAGVFKDVTITPAMVKKLLAGKEISSKKLYSPKKDTHFEGKFKLVLSDRENPADFQLVFDSEKPVEERSIGTCPRCGAPVIETKPGFICSKRGEGCRFAIWKTYKDKRFQKVRVSASMAKKLLAGQALTSKRLCSPSGEVYEGRFRLGDKGGDYGAFLTSEGPASQT